MLNYNHYPLLADQGVVIVLFPFLISFSLTLISIGVPRVHIYIFWFSFTQLSVFELPYFDHLWCSYRTIYIPHTKSLTRHSSHSSLIRRRSQASHSSEWVIHVPRSQPVQQNIWSSINQLILQHTLRPLLPLHFWLSLPAFKALFGLCRCLHPASNTRLGLHLRRPPS